MRRWELLTKERVFDGFFAVENVQVRFERSDGSMSETQACLCVERGDAVAVLVLHLELDAFVFVQQFRYPAHRHEDPWLLEIPAGKQEDGESPEASARREVEEETGFRPQKLEYLGQFMGSCGGLSETVRLFLAEVSEADRISKQLGLAQESEAIELSLIPILKMPEAIRSAKIIDAKAIIAYYHYLARDRT